MATEFFEYFKTVVTEVLWTSCCCCSNQESGTVSVGFGIYFFINFCDRYYNYKKSTNQ